MADRIEQVRCADIEVPDNRYRKDVGDLDGLAESIYGQGLRRHIGEIVEVLKEHRPTSRAMHRAQ